MAKGLLSASSNRRRIAVSGMLVALLSGAATMEQASAAQITTTLYAVADTYIDQGDQATSFGTLEYVRVGGPNQQRPGGPPVRMRWILLKFDLSGINPSTPLVSATLKLLPCGGSVPWCQIPLIKSSWSESTVTWGNWWSQAQWEILQGYNQFNPPAPGSSDWTGNVLGHVQRWLAGPNYGLILMPPPCYTESGQIDFRSREWATQAERPRLVIVQQTMMP